MKLSTFILGFLVVALVSVVFGYFIAGVNDNYTTVNVNETQLDVYDKVEELNELASDMNESLNTIQQGSAVDVVGGLLTSGFTVLKTTWVSFGLYTDVTDEAFNSASLGESASIWKTVALIGGLLLFIFAMIGVLIGRDV